MKKIMKLLTVFAISLALTGCMKIHYQINIIDKDNPLSFSTLRGPYININDSIYLHNSTFEALIKDFGYKINIDIESHNVEIKSE